MINAGLILHDGNEGDCLRVPWSLPWCPWNALQYKFAKLIIGCPLPRRKCLGAFALSKTNHTALNRIHSRQPRVGISFAKYMCHLSALAFIMSDRDPDCFACKWLNNFYLYQARYQWKRFNGKYFGSGTKRQLKVCKTVSVFSTKCVSSCIRC